MKKKVVILNGDCRNGLAVLRSLGAKGYICDICESDKPATAKMLGSVFKSKYVNDIHYLEPTNDEEKFLHRLLELIRTHNYDYLLAAGTRGCNFISKHKKKLNEYVMPLIDDYEKMHKLHNKIECYKYLKTIGIPVPDTFTIFNLDDLKRACNEINYPVVVKDPDSYASIGLWTFPEGGDALMEKYMHNIPAIVKGDTSGRIQYPVIQKRITGRLIDTTAFSIQGETISVLSQERIVTAWLDGGGGLVNITNDYPIIKKYTKSILHEINWTGPILLDWIRDEATGAFTLLEINPKFWGTTQLTISAGLDYPYWFVRHAEKKKVNPKPSYQIGLMYRWLFDELYAIITMSPNRKRLINELLHFLKRFRYKPCKTDIWLSDPKPAIRNFILMIYRLIFRKEYQRNTR